jgi:hypothetical protein
MMNRVVSFFIIGTLGWLLSGCSSSGDITDITVRMKKSTLGPQTGLISGALANYTSPEGYKVSSSVGSWSSDISQGTMGYTVFGSVQGSMVSESPDETIIVE